MDETIWSRFCGLGIVTCCLRPSFRSRREDGEDNIQREQQVMLDTAYMGNECVIVKNGTRICGSGGALATAPIMQDKAYFEIKIQSGGIWGIGVASRSCNLSKLPLGCDGQSAVFRSDGSLASNGVVHDRIDKVPQEGDYVGCSFNHVEINFFLNGKNLHCPLSSIKGTMYPVLFVDDGCILDASFDGFMYPPPPGYQKVMFEKNIL